MKNQLDVLVIGGEPACLKNPEENDVEIAIDQPHIQ